MSNKAMNEIDECEHLQSNFKTRIKCPFCKIKELEAENQRLQDKIKRLRSYMNKMEKKHGKKT